MNTVANDFFRPFRDAVELAGDFDTQIRDMSPRVQKLKNYWDARKQERESLPCICDIELMDIYEIASQITIIDVDENKEDLTNRFWGGELTWRFAFEATGKPVMSYQPPCFARKLIDHYQEVIQSHQPYCQKEMQVRGRYNSHIPVEALHLPLADKNHTHVKHVISIFDFTSERSFD